MWYMPYVRVRRAVVIYAVFAIAITFVAIAIRFWPGAIHFDAGNQMRLTQIRIDLSMVLSGAAAVVGGLATVFGLSLAAENEGHLELAWTKPISREGYALGVFAVDLAAMAICIVLTVVLAVLVTDVFLGHQAIDFTFDSGLAKALAYCGFPLCIYAWITALSASFKRNRGAVAGLFWPLMSALGVLVIVPIPLVHVIATALNVINPLAIFTTTSHGPPASIATYLSGWGVAAVLLVVALAQWRRLEV